MKPEERDALLPCPFCGGAANPATIRYDSRTVSEQGWSQDVFHYVSCETCLANNQGLRGFTDTASAAVAWNRRTAQSPAGVPPEPTPLQTGVGKLCHPGDRGERKWLLVFDDADRGINVYTDESQARRDFARAEGHGWNCHLFVSAERAAGVPTTEPVAPITRHACAMYALDLELVQGFHRHPQTGRYDVPCLAAPQAPVEPVAQEPVLPVFPTCDCACEYGADYVRHQRGCATQRASPISLPVEVPREPTPEMLEAGMRVFARIQQQQVPKWHPSIAGSFWRAMYDAATRG